MNTTDYFTYVNAMFLFCIFTCGLLVWAVIRGYILKGKLTKEQDSHLKATLINTKLNKALEDEKKVYDTVEKLLRQVESEVRELQEQLTNVQKTADNWIEVAETTAKELEATKSKVRKRDKDGKFLPRIPSNDTIEDEAMAMVRAAITAQPKLVHGLTVKNPTEAEAKMIFDEARRLGIDIHSEELSKVLPWIYFCTVEGDTVGTCTSEIQTTDIYVTAKDFVQRMQNGRG